MNAAMDNGLPAPPGSPAAAGERVTRPTARSSAQGAGSRGHGAYRTPLSAGESLRGAGERRRSAGVREARHDAGFGRTKRILGAAVTTALAASSFVAVPTALAATETAVMLVASDEQLSVTVPGSVTVGVKSDGTFDVPDLTIKNNSVFDVRVASIKATAAEGFSIVDKDALGSATGDNALWMTLAPDGATEVDLGSAIDTPAATASGKWTVGRASSGSAGTLSIKGAGAINELSGNATTKQKALDIAFTIAPGA